MFRRKSVTAISVDQRTGRNQELCHYHVRLVFDIPSSTHELVTNAGIVKLNLAPAGSIQSITDFGMKGFGGPCPPPGHGIHQYIITVYALKTDKLGLNDTNNPATVGFYLWSQTLAKASIVAYYKR
jgi:Raf kinase inhibitor-like YbhB/YbcL family protein